MSWFFKFCLGKTDESMQPYKVQTSHGKIRRIGIVASSMKDLLKKACQKLAVRSTYYRPSLWLTQACLFHIFSVVVHVKSTHVTHLGTPCVGSFTSPGIDAR